MSSSFTGSAPPATPSAFDQMISGLFSVVAVTGVLAVAAALYLFMPGTNAISVQTPAIAAEERPAPTVTTATVAAAATTTTAPPAAEEAAEAEAPSSTDATVAAEPEVAVLGNRITAGFVVHRVERGDTLSLIGEQFGVDWRVLADVNGIADPDLIDIGQVLRIPQSGADVAPELTAVPALLADDPERAALTDVFRRWSDQYGVPAELLMAVAWFESEWDNARVGEAGGIGIGQLSPETFAWVADRLVTIPLDPAVAAENIQLSAAYLGWLLDQTEGDTSAALAAYFQELQSQRNIPWTQEVVGYIGGVLALRPVFDPRAAVATAVGGGAGSGG